MSLRTNVHRKSQRCGFTLVELLVVIAIISVLAALLLPALEGAIRTAQKISCASRLKQIRLGMQCYMDEHDGWIFAFNSRSIVRPTLCRFQYPSAPELIPPYWFDLFPNELRICPSLEATVTETPYPVNLDYFQWGFATPMLEFTDSFGGPLKYMPNRQLSANGSVANSIVHPDYCRPLQQGLGRDFTTGEVYINSYWTNNKTFDPSGMAPMAADLHFRSISANTYLASHSTGAPKGTGTQMTGEGSNSVWADGHVQWNAWPGAVVSNYPLWVMSGRSGLEGGWVRNGNTYWQHCYWVLSGKK